MKTKSPAAKTIVTHPVTGSKRNFDATIYAAFRSAIISSLSKSDGKTFTELSQSVKEMIREKMPGFKGSVSWYTISVRLDLEAKGIVENFVLKGKKLSRLKK